MICEVENWYASSLMDVPTYLLIWSSYIIKKKKKKHGHQQPMKFQQLIKENLKGRYENYLYLYIVCNWVHVPNLEKESYPNNFDSFNHLAVIGQYVFGCGKYWLISLILWSHHPNFMKPDTYGQTEHYAFT